jgi:hypothetical protein
MSKKLSSVLILCMSAISLSGCSWFRVTGPCYGVGCPAGAPGHAGQYKPGEAPKAQNATAPAKSASAPTQSASAPAKPAAGQSPATDSVTAPAATAQSAPAPTASAQSTPAPDATPEAKPSPLHSIGVFFTHLIPHHNSGAKSGASD